MPARREEGFTLIELVVALSILAVAVAATATVFYAGIRTGTADMHRVNAVALATQEGQRLRVADYDQLGMPAGTTTANAPACDADHPIVIVSSGAVAPSDPAKTIAAVAYTVERCVEWVADSKSPTDAQSYKRTTVIVVWTDEVGSHSVRQDSIAYPGGLGPATTTTTTTAPTCGGTPAASTDLKVTPASSSAALLTWHTPGASPASIASWIVQYSTDSSFPAGNTNTYTDDLVSSAPGEVNTLIIGGLSPDVTSPAYWFQVIAVAPAACNSAPSAPNKASLGTDTGTNVGSCVALLVTLTPAVVPRPANHSVVIPQAVSITVNSNKKCTSMSARYSPTAGVTATVSLSQPVTGVWTGALPALGATDAWDLGLHAVTILEGSTQLGLAQLCVVNAGVTAC